MKFVTAADLLIRFKEKTGKSITLPTDLYNIIDEGLLEMKALGAGPRGTCYENHAPDVTGNRLKPHFIETNLK